MIMKFYISKLMWVIHWLIRNKIRIAMAIPIAIVLAGIGYYIWLFCKFFLFALVMCVIGAIFSSGRSGNDVDDDY